ncbi:AKT-interacting protein-like isoform X2 [Tachypleus tridentatus]|uniref:AKT-interacting protein-like isoform X2 n=1 Tax=Tachypleus tridentatus TaxID=6853 RepID=UPI003FD62897
MTEHVMLQRRRLPGVYVVPSAGSPLKWFGVLFIWQGHYQGGVFRFTLYMPHNYPDGDCPKEDNDTKVSTPSGLSWIQKGTLKIFSKTILNTQM